MKFCERPFDLAIVGAGPAGSHLAFRAAQAGFRVGLFDPKVPWEKPCGGGITHKAWSRFPFLADERLPKSEVYESLQISPNGRFFVIDQGYALLMVDRADLAALMLERATSAGAIHARHRIERIESKGGLHQLISRESPDEPIAARFVVGADGVRSVVRKHALGPMPKDRTLTSIWQLIEGDARDATLIRVTPFPGYVWGFARKNCLAVGAGAMEPGHRLKPHLEAFLTDFFPNRKPLTPIRGALLPYMKDWHAYRERRTGASWALIGDAAGFCDTLTGEGILYAVWSADLFADAFVKGRPEQYERSWRKAFGLHLLTGALVSKRLFTAKNIDRFFAALTVCPAFRRVFLDFVWNQPPYSTLLAKFIAAIPQAHYQWKRFIRHGGRIDPEKLGSFHEFEHRMNLTWP